MSDLPAPLAREIKGLPRHFEIRHSRLLDQVVLGAVVRGVPVTLYLDLDTYPAAPPRLELDGEWCSPLADRSGRLRGLTSLERWNRTLGIGYVLRELEQQFRGTPPTRQALPSRGDRRPFLKRLSGWVAALFGWSPRSRDGGPTPDAIRARYEGLIEEKTGRLLRYRQAVSNLVEQLAAKRARLAELTREMERQEERRAGALDSSRREVATLEQTGSTTDEIRHAAGYLEGLAEFKRATADLEESRQEAREMEQESKRLHDLIETHQGRLEGLMDELENLREEAAEKVAELTFTQAETEIRDVLSDLSPGGFAGELEDLRRQVEEIESSGRVSRELAELEASAQGREFLASGNEAAATEVFDVLLGLGEVVDENAAEPSRNRR